MNFLIGTVAGNHRIQWAMALIAVEAFLVPHGTLGQLLFGGKHGTPATWATFTSRSLDGCGASDDEWTVVGGVVFTVDLNQRLEPRSSQRQRFFNQRLPLSVSLQESRATSKAVAVWAPFLAITGSTVDVLVGTIASNDRVKSLVAVFALEAFAMPFASLGQHLLSGKDSAATAGTTLTGWCFDGSSVSHCGSWCVGFTG